MDGQTDQLSPSLIVCLTLFLSFLSFLSLSLTFSLSLSLSLSVSLSLCLSLSLPLSLSFSYSPSSPFLSPIDIIVCSGGRETWFLSLIPHTQHSLINQPQSVGLGSY